MAPPPPSSLAGQTSLLGFFQKQPVASTSTLTTTSSPSKPRIPPDTLSDGSGRRRPGRLVTGSIKKRKISLEQGTVDEPVCLLDSSDEDLVEVELIEPREGGKQRQKRESSSSDFKLSLNASGVSPPGLPKVEGAATENCLDLDRCLVSESLPRTTRRSHPPSASKLSTKITGAEESSTGPDSHSIIIIDQETFEHMPSAATVSDGSKLVINDRPRSCLNWEQTTSQAAANESIDLTFSGVLQEKRAMSDIAPGEDDLPGLYRDEGFGMHDDEQEGMLDPGEDEEEDYERYGLGDDGEEEDPVEMIEDEDESSIEEDYKTKPSLPPPTKNAFAMMMTKSKTVDVWKDVEDDRSIKRGGKVIKAGERRRAPFFKVLTGMPICVDGFRYGKIPKVTAYLLSHAHSDHYTKLSKTWKHGPIYCSQTTANLIIRKLGVDSKWVKPLEFDKPTELPGTGGVVCTMIEANHCPGSAIFLFEGRRTVHAGDSPYVAQGLGGPKVYRYLHCGDFRACPKHVMHPAIRKAKLDEIYLDTTYLNPKYCFPPQPTVIESVSLLARELVQGGPMNIAQDSRSAITGSPGESKSMMTDWLHKFDTEEQKKTEADRIRRRGLRTLVAVGTYSIGKERIVKGIAHALGSRIYCDAYKRAIVNDQTEDPELNELITDNPSQSQVHMISLHDISHEGLTAYLKKHTTLFDRIIGFRPTGWTYTPNGGTNMSASADLNMLIARDQQATFDARDLKPSRGSSDKVTMYGGEPRMIPTVNVGSQGSRQKMDIWIKKWAVLKKKRLVDGRGGIIEYRSIDYW
ncbi:Predicted hydrolase involved in interstrand cross-link repair [Phaffia rhodozyma]|uniref:Predicted hydrolase involved in interstrand cross-link repair n=1 Tax=Phaffia rhodozyma TaxID=264483 RepID=A0A0F7SVC0_PHARH|nr:Predicted hydrolase involved in interstrand cross-link repair [Phaffia rhodozyma]